MLTPSGDQKILRALRFPLLLDAFFWMTLSMGQPIEEMVRRILEAGEVPPDVAVRRVSRIELADLLTRLGYPLTTKVLAIAAHRGDGPEYQRFGKMTLYLVGPAVVWAHARLRPPRARRSGGADAAVPLAGAA